MRFLPLLASVPLLAGVHAMPAQEAAKNRRTRAHRVWRSRQPVPAPRLLLPQDSVSPVSGGPLRSRHFFLSEGA